MDLFDESVPLQDPVDGPFSSLAVLDDERSSWIFLGVLLSPSTSEERHASIKRLLWQASEGLASGFVPPGNSVSELFVSLEIAVEPFS